MRAGEITVRPVPHPDAPAVIEDGAVTTWAALEAKVDQLAAGLAALGLEPGDRAVWCGPNSTDVVVLMHAYRRLALVSVPMPYRLTAGEAEHVLADSGASVAVVDAAYAGPIPGALTVDDVLAFSPVDAVVPEGRIVPRWSWDGRQRG